MSWSRHDGRAGAYSRRPASVGGSVTMARSASSTSPPRVVTDHPALLLLDAAHRAVQGDPIAEGGGHGLAASGWSRPRSGPAGHPGRCSATLRGRCRSGRRTGRGGPRGCRSRPRTPPRWPPGSRSAPVGVRRLRTDPGLEGLVVERLGPRGRPGPVERHLVGQSLEPGHALEQVGQHEGIELGHGPPLRGHPALLASELDHVLAGVVGREGLEPQLLGPGRTCGSGWGRATGRPARPASRRRWCPPSVRPPTRDRASSTVTSTPDECSVGRRPGRTGRLR